MTNHNGKNVKKTFTTNNSECCREYSAANATEHKQGKQNTGHQKSQEHRKHYEHHEHHEIAGLDVAVVSCVALTTPMTPPTNAATVALAEMPQPFVHITGTADTTCLVALQAQLQQSGWFVAILDRAPVYDQETLFHALYQAGQFPGYFGFNWDSLADCLMDLSWLDWHPLASQLSTEVPTEKPLSVKESTGYAFLWQDIGVLEERQPQTLETLGRVAEDVEEMRKARAQPPLRFLLLEHSKGA